MASVSVPQTLFPLTQNTVTVTALTAATAYICTVTWPSGRKQLIPFTTDGSGNATPKVVPQFDDRGTPQFDIRLATEHSAGTTPVLTSSAGKV
jgi:type IV secretory pathway TrbF-like protein